MRIVRSSIARRVARNAPLVAVGVALALALPAGTAGADAICPEPTNVTGWWNAHDPLGLCESEAEAKRTCKVFLKLCKKRVKAMAKCALKERKNETALKNKQCGLPDLPISESDCKQTVKTDHGIVTDGIKTNLGHALDQCESHDCVGRCQL